MSKNMLVVLREVAPGDFQYVPVNETPSLSFSDKVFFGEVNTHEENLGPHGSHRRTICLPAGKLTQVDLPTSCYGALPTGVSVHACALRDVSGSQEYRPTAELPFLNDGELVAFGAFRTQQENHGPSGSHRLTVALPAADLGRFRIGARLAA